MGILGTLFSGLGSLIGLDSHGFTGGGLLGNLLGVHRSASPVDEMDPRFGTAEIGDPSLEQTGTPMQAIQPRMGAVQDSMSRGVGAAEPLSSQNSTQMQPSISPETSMESAQALKSVAPESIRSLIGNTVKQVGSPLPTSFYERMAQIESRFNPNAKSSTGAEGLFQFTKGTWSQFGSGNRLDPAANTAAAVKLANSNYNILKHSLGREPLPGEVYMAHNIGAGGAIRLLRANPDQVVSKALIGSLPSYNPKYLMSGRRPVTAGEAVKRYVSDFNGVQ